MDMKAKCSGRTIAGWILETAGAIMLLMTVFEYNSLSEMYKRWYNYIEYLYDLDPGYGLLFLVGSIAIIAGIVVLATKRQEIVVEVSELPDGTVLPAMKGSDAFADLETAKKMLDAGLITQEDFEKTKKRILGI